MVKSRREKNILTRQMLANHLIEKLDYSHREASRHVEGFIETFVELLSDGNHLKISYLGDFVLQDKKARPGRNPQTGEAYEISKRRVVKFHSASKLKGMVRGGSINVK